MKESKTIEIPLWKNKHELSEQVTVIDAEDYDKVMTSIGRGKWYMWASSTGRHYAMSGNRAAMHRVVVDAPKGMDVDHIDGNPLNNRKDNLRICTRSENCMNKSVRKDSASGYKGVYELKRQSRSKYIKKSGEVSWYERKPPKKRFRAGIGNTDVKQRKIWLGYFYTAEEAAEAYDRKAVALHGEFACVNFPERLEEYLSEG